MPLSAVISLEALTDGRLDQFTGRGVHGFWFNHWRNVDAVFADSLHENTQDASFSLSPLLGLPSPRGRGAGVRAGQTAFFRIGMLTEELAQSFEEKWLKALTINSEIEIPQAREERETAIPGQRWKVTAHALESNQHPMAGRVGYEELSRKHLMNPNPPRQWKVEFLSPTTFHGKAGHLPFPLPESLINSWMRRWQAFAPIALPQDEISEWARGSLVVSSYSLRTVPAREADRLRIGCVGTLTLRALDMPPYLRAAIDLLAAYSFFCGSGAHTTQGLGQTQCVPSP
ncbi:MAG: CRISPR-associated endoribonuclease Cas6 [Chloroflexi bacterium]|nr:CRISPR-associated endoribonuclease Cas6 [Chloroflexota bacterium]